MPYALIVLCVYIANAVQPAQLRRMGEAASCSASAHTELPSRASMRRF